MKTTALQSVKREITAHANANRVIAVEPYTLARWAAAARNRIPDLTDLASRNRQIKIQPYTFTRWLVALTSKRR